jgi:hypothetical protein
MLAHSATESRESGRANRHKTAGNSQAHPAEMTAASCTMGNCGEVISACRRINLRIKVTGGTQSTRTMAANRARAASGAGIGDSDM